MKNIKILGIKLTRVLARSGPQDTLDVLSIKLLRNSETVNLLTELM